MTSWTPDPRDDMDATVEQPRTLPEWLDMLRRRRGLMALVFTAVLGVALAVAWLLPSVYRSSATILIKEQEIPPELVRSTVTSFADERIQVITQQVMTRATLLDMVERNQLYGKARLRETGEEIIDRMRRDIRITPISAEVTDRRTGAPVKATIAFSLSYDSEVAANAQKISSELVTLFLNENVKNRQQKAAETTSFLDEELGRIGARVSELEQGLADFKRRNPGRLPEMSLSNQVASERLLTEVQRLDRDISFLDERRIALQTQLADTRPNAPIAAGGGVLEPEERLRALQVQLISLSGLYSDDHPDVRRLRREISAFKLETGLQNTAIDREARLAELRTALATLRQRYSDDHPDVVKLKRTYTIIEAVVRSGGEAGAPQPAVSTPRKPDNPGFLNLQAQVQTTVAQIQSLRTERDLQRARLEQIDLRLSQAPEVEREYFELARDLDSTRARFRELREKQMQAQVAEELERSRKAERFTLIEPPIYPEKPYRPNRAAILLMGLLLALAGGAAAAALAEALDQNAHGVRAVAQALRAPVLAVLPALAAPRATRSPQAMKLLFIGGAAATLTLGLAALAGLHFFHMPLDVAWFSLLRRLGG